MMRSILILGLLALSGATRWFELEGYTFDKYTKEFGKSYTPSEYRLRKALFDARLDAIKAHNSNPEFTWKQGVNHLSDRTDEEFGQLRGLDSATLFNTPRPVQPVEAVSLSDLPAAVDWRNRSVITPVKNQASCGSCWTFGTAETIESFYALSGGPLTVLSEQQILDCTPNPNDCGGTGGCGGGTAEIAMARIKEMGGLTSEKFYPYVSGNGQDFKCHFGNSTSAPVAKLSGYVNIPSNQYGPVLTALATIGPLIINVDASQWSAYESGVFNGCNQKNPDIDHVVQLVGYGTDSKLGDYWIVRNSWTASWGEQGYIRLHRSSTPVCGQDTNPSDGTGCNNGPSQVTVCGTCGILFDALYPVIAK